MDPLATIMKNTLHVNTEEFQNFITQKILEPKEDVKSEMNMEMSTINYEDIMGTPSTSGYSVKRGHGGSSVPKTAVVEHQAHKADSMTQSKNRVPEATSKTCNGDIPVDNDDDGKIMATEQRFGTLNFPPINSNNATRGSQEERERQSIKPTTEILKTTPNHDGEPPRRPRGHPPTAQMLANVDSYDMDNSSAISRSEQKEHRYQRRLQSNHAAFQRYQINRMRKLKLETQEAVLKKRKTEKVKTCPEVASTTSMVSSNSQNDPSILSFNLELLK